MNKKPKQINLSAIKNTLAADYKKMMPQVRLDLSRLKSDSLAGPLKTSNSDIFDKKNTK